jgi:undecaprenyl-diphosphatase
LPLAIAIAGAALVVVLHLRHRYAESALVLVVALVTQVLSTGVRTLVARSRPTDKFVEQAGFAFPSGHTVHATVAALLCVLLLLPHLARRVGRRPASAHLTEDPSRDGGRAR